MTLDEQEKLRSPRPSKVSVTGRTLIPPVCRPAVVTVTEDAEHEARRLQKDKQDEAEWLARHITQDLELQQERIRQDNLSYGG
jgi:hypothetical protein